MRGLMEAVAEHYQQDIENTCSAFGWTITRANKGMNGLVYKAISDYPSQKPLAVKISKRDERKRSEREYGAMQALWGNGIDDVCPFPLLLIHEPAGLPGDAVVSQWVEGQPFHEPPPPADKTRWYAILRGLSQAHRVKKHTARIKLDHSVFAVEHPADLLAILDTRRNWLPDALQSGLARTEIDNLMDVLARRVPAYWERSPELTLIHCDSNPNNMLEADGYICFVDWENSGWADPAYDVGELLAAPGYFDLPAEHRDWILDTSAQLMLDSHFIERAHVYEKIMNVFWVINAANQLTNTKPGRLAGVHEYSDEHHLTMQKNYYERAIALLGL